MPESPPSGQTPVGLPRRLAAMVYDSLLLAAVLVVATALAVGLTVAVIGSAAFQAHNPLPGNPFFRTYLLLVCFLFYAGFWVCGGQTLGLRAWRLRIRQRDGRGIRWQQALLRFLIGGLWLLPTFYLHQVLRLGVGASLGAGFVALLLLLALRLPDRVSETELTLSP